jgi:hypothetical protein
VVKVHPEDPKWMEVHMPPYLVLWEKSNAFDGYALAPLKNCYLLPAAPSVYEGPYAI